MYLTIFDIDRNIRAGYYRFIGQGSSRKVYDMRNGYVLKVAKNKAGMAQNAVEYAISINDDNNIFAEVFDISDDSVYLVMERARTIYDFDDVLDYFKVNSEEELKKLKIIKKIINEYHLLWGDIKKATSWGIIRGRLVLIDYGFVNEVRKRYY